MFGIRIKAKVTEFNQRLKRIGAYAETRSNNDAARIVIAGIKARTSKGVDADNKRFPRWSSHHDKPGFNYSPSQTNKRKKAGATVSKKNLRITNEMLQSLHLNNGTLITVDDAHALIARGQMEHPAWPYHHRFLMTNDEDVASVEQKIAHNIQKIAGEE